MPETFEEWKKRKSSPLTEFEKQAEVEKTLNDISPEPELPEFKPKIVDFNMNIKEEIGENETQVTQIRQPHAEKIVYKIQKNSNLLLLMNVANSKIYFDVRTSEFYQYVFQPDRKRILRKMRLENHDILNLGILFLWAVLRDKPLHVGTRLHLNRNIRSKIAELRRKEGQFYGEPEI